MRQTRHPIAIFRCDQGTATVEFALVMPFALFISLLLIQVMLLMTGYIYVNYSAFAAIRAAITTIPYATELEPSNMYFGGSTTGKHEGIRRAAVFAVVPVSGQTGSSSGSSGGTLSGTSFVSALEEYYTASGKEVPKWVDSFASERLQYADANTTVKVFETVLNEDGTVTMDEIAEGSQHLFGPNDPITVEVTHKFSLTVPYVRKIFSEADGSSSSSGSSQYTTITAHYTLNNEGIAKTLPPAPELPRDP